MKLTHPNLDDPIDVPAKSARALAASGWSSPDSDEATADVDKNALLVEAQALGVEGVSGRWGVDRLRDAIASHTDPNTSEED